MKIERPNFMYRLIIMGAHFDPLSKVLTDEHLNIHLAYLTKATNTPDYRCFVHSMFELQSADVGALVLEKKDGLLDCNFIAWSKMRNHLPLLYNDIMAQKEEAHKYLILVVHLLNEEGKTIKGVFNMVSYEN